MKRTPAQIKAQKKYDAKRQREQLNIKLNSDEKQFFEDAFSTLEGSRKEILIKALKMLLKA